MDINNLNYLDFISYSSAIDPIEKQEQLNMLSVEIYPHLKVDGRNKLFSSLKKGILSAMQSDNKIKQYGDLVASLKRQMSGR